MSNVCPVCRRDFGRGRAALNALANHTRDKHDLTIDTRIRHRLDDAFKAILSPTNLPGKEQSSD
jgi:hypothetical protein